MRRRLPPRRLPFALALAALALAACGGPERPEIWIYTSIYKEIYPRFEPGLKAAFPDADVRWYQSGSEKIAAKILAEEKGGGTRADLLFTSDVFFFQELEELGLLLPLDSAVVAGLPAELRDPGGGFVVQRFPLMVIAYNPMVVSQSDAPKGFADLLDPRFQGLLTMPSPLESGTTLTSVLYLDDAFGDDYFAGLRRNDVLAAGGNGATLARIQSGERPVGIVLLENVLAAQARDGGLTVQMVIPEEGALVVPGPLAVLRRSPHPDLARRVLDWLLGPQARQVVVAAGMHTAFPEDPAPAGVAPLGELRVMPWSLATFATWSGRRQDVKTRFQRTVLQ